MKWIKEVDTKPEFGVTVLVWCKIYGIFLTSYEDIGEIGGVHYGNWRDPNSGMVGILPPVYWMEVPPIPKSAK